MLSGTISEYTNVRENRKGNEESTMETQAIVGKLHCALYLQFSRTDCSRQHPPRGSLYLQFSRTDCTRQHPPRGSLYIVLAVLKDRLHQTTSTKRFVQCTMHLLMDDVWNNLSLRTASTMKFLVDNVWSNLSLRTESTMHNEPLGG
jgi:hypothetical protein